MLPPEDEDNALKLVQYLESYFSEQMDQYERNELFYEGEFEDLITVPDNFSVTIPTTGRAVVDEAVESIVPADILVSYPPRGLTQKAELDAENNGRWIRWAWQHLRRRSADIDPIRDFLRNLFMFGKATLKVVPDYTLWPILPEEEEKALREEGGTALLDRVRDINELREGNFPLTVRSVHPRCIMEDPTINSRKLFVVEVYDMAPDEVRNLYSQYIEEFRDADESPWQSVTVHEIWTAKYIDYLGKLHKAKHFIMVNRTVVKMEDSPFDNLPYFVKFSGHGRETYDGRPQYKSVGFFTPQVESNLLAEARRYTQFDSVMSQVAYPTAFLPDSLDDGTVSMEPGSVNYIPEDMMAVVQNMFVKAPVLAPEYQASLGAIGQQIERGTVQRSIRGAPLPGADSAAQYGLQSNNAKLRLDSCKQEAERAMAEASSFMLRYVDKHLKTKVSVFVEEGKVDRYTVGPKTIQGHYAIGITFQPNEDAIKERKLVLANDAITKGGMSPYDAYQYAGFENPLELVARRLAWDTMMADPVKTFLGQQLLLEYGIDADQLEIAGRQKDMQKQFMLRGMANSMQLGTAAGQEAAQGPAPGPGPQAGGPTAGMGGAPGAPPVVMGPGVSTMANDINSMNSGVAA